VTAATKVRGMSFRGWGGRGEVAHLYREESRVFLGFRVGP
jgi:hypothetical protein